MKSSRRRSLLGHAAAGLVLAASLVFVLAGCTGDPDADGTGNGANALSTPVMSGTPPGSAVSPSPDTGTSPGKAVACAVPSPPAVSSGAGGPVDRDAAGRLVTDTYGGNVLSVESDTYRGTPTWEVEASGGDCGRIEVDVDKATGRIVSFETDD
jgi:hypothetical protein